MPLTRRSETQQLQTTRASILLMHLPFEQGSEGTPPLWPPQQELGSAAGGSMGFLLPEFQEGAPQDQDTGHGIRDCSEVTCQRRLLVLCVGTVSKERTHSQPLHGRHSGVRGKRAGRMGDTGTDVFGKCSVCQHTVPAGLGIHARSYWNARAGNSATASPLRSHLWPVSCWHLSILPKAHLACRPRGPRGPH